MPVVLGHEGSGTVAEVGPEVTYARPGEHVVLSFVPSCGRCSYCLRGRQNLCEVRYGLRGNLVDGTKRLHKDGQEICHFNGLSTFGEYAVVPEDALVLVRDDALLDKLALIGCGVPIGVGAAINTAKVQPGSRVVIGVGGVGLNVVQGAAFGGPWRLDALAGAGMIIAVHIRGTKLEQSLEFGATHLVNAASEDVVARVRDITNGEMAYIPLMPIFAVDILKVGADGQGWLMGIGGVAAKGGNASKTLLIIGGGIMSGVVGYGLWGPRASRNRRPTCSAILACVIVEGAIQARYQAIDPVGPRGWGGLSASLSVPAALLWWPGSSIARATSLLRCRSPPRHAGVEPPSDGP